MRFSPRNSKTPRQPPFFSHSTKTSLFSCVVCKALWEKATFKPRKELGRDLYSVPSFGSHIAISHDVTVYPFLVMARTVSGVVFSVAHLLKHWRKLLVSCDDSNAAEKCRQLLWHSIVSSGFFPVYSYQLDQHERCPYTPYIEKPYF